MLHFDSFNRRQTGNTCLATGALVAMPFLICTRSPMATASSVRAVTAPRSAKLWFRNAPEGEMLREMKHTSDKFERVLSLLIVPKFDLLWTPDGDDHDCDTFDRFIERRQLPVR
ncbi:hypothetical protein [Sulfurivermis fontis]|uniref:hypothetical protein n=1 Tax=Sulfurivermis fontis TaxID=1972068 RepID=UPI000FDAED7B|nr:hypothetical protein [Sulfurivermis fontis]